MTSKTWKITIYSIPASVGFQVENSYTVPFSITINRNNTTIGYTRGYTSMEEDISSIAKFHTQNYLFFYIIFNVSNGFTINYLDNNIYTFPNIHDISDANTIIYKTYANNVYVTTLLPMSDDITKPELIRYIEAMKPLGWFDADGDGFNEITQKWKSKYGDYTINTSNVKKDNSPFSFVYGGTNATLTNIPWPGLNKPYTFIHLTKYNGTTKKRIWTDTTGNWFSGFYFSRIDNSHAIGYNQLGRSLAFGLDYSKRGDDWLLSIDMSKKIRVNKGAYEISDDSGQILSPKGITVNGGLIKDFSDFAIAEFLIFNRVLSKDEYNKVEEYICHKYGLFGLSRVPSLSISPVCPLTSTPVFVSGSVQNNKITTSKSKGWQISMEKSSGYNIFILR